MLNEILNIYESGLRDGQQSLTQTEAIHKICEKINLLINHFNLLEYNTNEAIKEFSDKVEYYLNNGMVEEVCRKLDEFAENGTLDTIINDHVFGEIKSQIQDIKSDIADFKQTYIDNKTVTDNKIQANFIELSKAVADLDKRAAVERQQTVDNFAFLNNKIDNCKQEVLCYVNATFVPGKLVMPLDSICPPAQPATTTPTTGA